MELLYTWINYSNRGTFQQQGINFSPEFEFVFERSHDKWVLYEDANWKKRKTIFKNNTIENVTAIVGKNGAGKTSLLDYLSGLDCSPQRELCDERYEKLEEIRIRDSLCLLIIRDGERITIYHNFEEVIENRTEYLVENMCDSEKYREHLLAKTGFKDIFIIYTTNSSFGASGKTSISSHGKLDQINLTPAALSTIESVFYRKLLELNQVIYYSNADRQWRDLVRNWRKGTNFFQQISDMVYFNRLYEKDIIQEYVGKVPNQISLTCASATGIMSRIYPHFDDTDPVLLNEQKELYNYYQSIKKVIGKFDLKVNFIIRNLIINLMFELCLEKNVPFPEKVKGLEDSLSWILVERTSCINSNYYFDAVEEIQKMQEIIAMGEPYENVVPEEDLAYNSSIIYDYERNLDGFRKLLEFISSCFEKEKSVVLRYIVLGSSGMSSGERAFLNLFSWINLLPQYHNIDSTIPNEMRGTILLLIDEVDLYLHPEWQKKYISLLIDEIERQFSGYKVQIIFATHSPLCLSDIPRENTIYLNDKQGTVYVEKRENHDQTFGKDLYSLLNNAFFLENSTMGAYAEKYVNSIIGSILDSRENYIELSAQEAEELYERIMYIGNDILRKKLTDMLHKCVNDTQQKRQLLLKYREKIDQKLAELEA